MLVLQDPLTSRQEIAPRAADAREENARRQAEAKEASLAIDRGSANSTADCESASPIPISRSRDRCQARRDEGTPTVQRRVRALRTRSFV